MRLTCLILALAVLAASTSGLAQTPGAAAPPPAGAQNVEVDPIRCWWRTSTGAIRVGETFSVVLTCAVLQNQAVQVVPDESRLDATVAQMAPFEIVGGAHPADLYRGDRRFFQYEYQLRIINPDVIGTDVRIPDPMIHYRVNSTVAANTALQGRDHSYVMPPHSVRVLSLVPGDAPDIRDAASQGFGAAEELGFRANATQIAALTAMALGGLLILLGLGRIAMRARRQDGKATRGLSERTVLGVAGRELADVDRQKDAGWNEDLAGRALAAARVAAATALGRPVSQQPADGVRAGDGRILFQRRRGKAVLVSGAVTSETLAHALNRQPEGAPASRREILDDLRAAIAAFTDVQYAPPAAFDGSALDEALSRALKATRSLRSQHAWPASYFRGWTARAEATRA